MSTTLMLSTASGSTGRAASGYGSSHGGRTGRRRCDDRAGGAESPPLAGRARPVRGRPGHDHRGGHRGGRRPGPPPSLLCVQADLKAPASTGCSAITSSRSCPTRTPWWPRPSGSCAPAAAFVLALSDFDTLIFASEDLELTRRLVRDYCDTEQSWMDSVDGTIGRRLADIAGRAGLVVEDVQAAVVLGRRFVPGEIGWGYARNLADTLGATAGPPRPSWTAGWPGCSGSTTGGRSCSVSTTMPSSVVECPGDALHATGATVRRPTSR